MAERPRVWLGGRIKELRQERQLNQQALGNILKRSVSWVSQVERGEIEVTDVPMLQRLAAALGVPSRELVEVVLGEEAGEAEHKRPYVEALRVTLAGHPAPQSVVGTAKDRSATSATASLDRLAVQVQWAWVSRITENARPRSSKMYRPLSAVGGCLDGSQRLTITSSPRSSATATGSSHDGHEPPRPTLRVKVRQASQYCSPTVLTPQLSHS